MNIAVIGIGGVGGYFGGKLTRLLQTEKDVNIYFIARNQHLQAINKSGLILDTEEGELICKPTSATDHIPGLPQLDLCLLCVKSYDLKNVLKQLPEKITGQTVLLPLLNGVDIYERIRSEIRDGVVFPSCVYVGTHIEAPGKVKQRGGACTIHFGKDPENDYVSPVLFTLFQKAGIKYIWHDNPYTEIWSKFVFIASFGLVTAHFDKTLGEVLQSEELSRYVKAIMHEIVEIADKKKIILPSTIIQDTYAKAGKFPFETKTSFQRDYQIPDKPDERDLFGGAIMRMGKALGVAAGTTEWIYSALQKGKLLL